MGSGGVWTVSGCFSGRGPGESRNTSRGNEVTRQDSKIKNKTNIGAQWRVPVDAMNYSPEARAKAARESSAVANRFISRLSLGLVNRTWLLYILKDGTSETRPPPRRM